MGVQSTTSNLAAALSYFCSKDWDRLLTSVLKKYEQLGRVGGTAIVSEPTGAELAAVRDFFGKSPAVDRHGRLCVPLAKLDVQLRQTRFGCGLLELLEAYRGLPVTANERAQQENARWREFLAQVERRITATGPENNWALKWWALIRAEEGCRQDDAGSAVMNSGELPGSLGLLRQAYLRAQDDVGALLDELGKTADALARLPLSHLHPSRLPVFATEVCGDPHAFDANRLAGRLLERALTSLHPDPSSLLQGVSSATLRRDLLLAWAGLQRDDISSTVLVANLSGDRLLHTMRNRSVIVALPLRVLVRLERVKAWHGRAFVVENPAVFAVLAETVEQRLPVWRRPTLVCPSGQPSMAAITLLDKLSGKTDIYYSGDFDGAGVGITINLMRRYGARLIPWRMSADDYLRACKGELSRPELGARDRKQLQQAQPSLPELVAEMMKNGVKAYEEALVSDLCTDVIQFCARRWFR